MKTYMKPEIEKIDFVTNSVLSGENDVISTPYNPDDETND